MVISLLLLVSHSHVDIAKLYERKAEKANHAKRVDVVKGGEDAICEEVLAACKGRVFVTKNVTYQKEPHVKLVVANQCDTACKYYFSDESVENEGKIF